MLIDAVINQVKYPRAGDVDECWLVSTVMCARAIRGGVYRGNTDWYRGAAGDPDDGHNDGGSTKDILTMCKHLWPDIRVFSIGGHSWAWLAGKLRANRRPVSLAVWSGALPSKYRFGFNGGHQVAVFYEDGKFWIANPLAPEGSKPMAISATALKAAAYRITGNGTVRGVLFPTAAEAARTWNRYNQSQVDAAVAAAEAAAKAAANGDLAAANATLEQLRDIIDRAASVLHEADEVSPADGS